MHITQADGDVFWPLSAKPGTVLTACTPKYCKVKAVFYHHFSMFVLSELSTASQWGTAVPEGDEVGPQWRPCPHQWVLSHRVWPWWAETMAMTRSINSPWDGKWRTRARDHPGASVRSWSRRGWSQDQKEFCDIWPRGPNIQLALLWHHCSKD